MAVSSCTERYLKSSGALCPFCEGTDITSGPIQADGPVAWADELTLGLYAKAHDHSNQAAVDGLRLLERGKSGPRVERRRAATS